MKFHEGATVSTPSGEKVGTLDRVVVDPATRDVTHLVVGKGMLLPHDILVPVADVGATPSEETVILKAGARPDAYETFEGIRYSAEPGGPAPMASAFEVYPITGVPPTYPGAVPPPPAPAEPVAPPAAGAGPAIIGRDMPVFGEAGRKVGKVEEVVTSDDGSLEAIVAKSGILWFARRRVIPAGWIREIRPTELRLSVTKDHVASTADRPITSIGQRPPGR